MGWAREARGLRLRVKSFGFGVLGFRVLGFRVLGFRDSRSSKPWNLDA